MAKKKNPPPWLKNRFLISLFQSKVGVLFSNWLAQCMLYAEPVEVLFRLTLEAFIFCLLAAIYWSTAPFSLWSLIVLLVVTHTVTFFINGHFFVTGRFLDLVHNEPKPFIEYPEGLRRRLQNKKSIAAVVMFGSLSRDHFSPSSDLDVRVIARDGFINNFTACFHLFLERFRALLNKYPLDAYVVTKTKGLEKLRSDEPPVVLFDQDGFISQRYDEYVNYDTYKDQFLLKFAGAEA